MGTERKAHKEERGFELLQGSEIFQGELSGGCLESLCDILTDSRYEDEKEVCERYGLFPKKEEWIGKILFIETCEEKTVPELFMGGTVIETESERLRREGRAEGSVLCKPEKLQAKEDKEDRYICERRLPGKWAAFAQKCIRMFSLSLEHGGCG